MKSIKVRLTKIDGRLDFKNNLINFTIFFEDDSALRELSKRYVLDDDVGEFVKNFIAQIKQDCKKRHQGYGTDILEGFVQVYLDEKEAGDTEEKIINAINKVKLNVKNFRRIKSADDYMNKYYALSKIKIDL